MAERDEMRVKPIIFEVEETGEEYTLEFNRESVKYAEKNGFKVDDLGEAPLTAMEDLFFYSFRMHHPRVDRTKAMRILYDVLGGYPDGWTERLGALYAAPFEALLAKEDISKNSKVTIKQ